MRIALLAPLRFPIAEPFHGGLEMHTYLLAQGLHTAGHEVTLYAHPDSDVEVKLHPVHLEEKAGLLHQSLVYHRVMRLIRDGVYDAVHNNSIHFLPPLLAGMMHCPVVTTLHTPPYKSLRWGGRISRAKNHFFVSISQHLHDVWSPFIGAHQVVHNGIDFTDWPFSNTVEPRSAVWYGRMTPEKGTEFAIEAARLAGYRLTLAGPLYDQVYFDEKIAPLLGDDITYAGHLNRVELASLIGRSAVGIVTSVWDEPFGLVYLEMPACGTPVAAFDSGAAGEIITSQTGAIVPKHDIRALAQVLGRLEGGDRAACREAVVERFSLGRMVDNYVGLYQ